MAKAKGWNLRIVYWGIGLLAGMPVALADFPVLIQKQEDGAYIARGDIGSAHNRSKAGGRDQLGCWVNTELLPSGESTWVSCSAVDYNGVVFNCSTTSAAMIANARGINALSHVSLASSVLTGGTCTRLTVYNVSTSVIATAP